MPSPTVGVSDKIRISGAGRAGGGVLTVDVTGFSGGAPLWQGPPRLHRARRAMVSCHPRNAALAIRAERNRPSWPGLSRPSTSCLQSCEKDVDARDKPGHDVPKEVTPWRPT